MCAESHAPPAATSKPEHTAPQAFLEVLHAPALRSLLAAVVGRHHQVAVRPQVLDHGGPAAGDRRVLALHPGDLEHAAWVMLQQVALEGLPAPAHPHHHVLVVQHLKGGSGAERDGDGYRGLSLLSHATRCGLISHCKPFWKSAPYDITSICHTSRWTRPPRCDVIRGRFPKRLVTANHTTPGGMSWDL